MVVIYESEAFRLKSFGGGFAYELVPKGKLVARYCQGESAERFREQWEAWTSANPGTSADVFFAERFAERGK